MRLSALSTESFCTRPRCLSCCRRPFLTHVLTLTGSCECRTRLSVQFQADFEQKEWEYAFAHTVAKMGGSRQPSYHGAAAIAKMLAILGTRDSRLPEIGFPCCLSRKGHRDKDQQTDGLKRWGVAECKSKHTKRIQRMFRDAGWHHGTPLACGRTCSLARSSFQARMGAGGGAGSTARGYAAMLAGQIDLRPVLYWSCLALPKSLPRVLAPIPRRFKMQRQAVFRTPEYCRL